jgi:glutamyl-tRNA reductase
VNLRHIGCNFRTTPVEMREKLAFTPETQTKAALELSARFGCEVVILSTCNRVELTVARPITVPPFTQELAAEFLSESHRLPATQILPHLYTHADGEAVRHLFRVASSLDSLIVGEGQIAGQVKKAFEFAQQLGTTGPLLNALFPQALRTAKRVRTETGISQGHVSVSSVAVDYVKQVFDRFADKTVLVIGAGKMGRLTLKHLEELKPGRILVTNRSPEKAVEVASGCGGTAIPWDKLDDALGEADIVLSTTGAGEPIVPRKRYDEKIRPKRRHGRTLVVLDIAVPRDFDSTIHDGERVCVFNIDDLTRIREKTIGVRQSHIRPAESIIVNEVKAFQEDWQRRKNGPVIQQLRSEVDKVRDEVLQPLLGKLNGKLTAADQEYIAGAFRLFQNKLLHGPIAALQEASKEDNSSGLLEAMKKLFRLG